MEIDRGETESLGFPKEARLRKSPEFERVYLGNIYAADSMLVVQAVAGSGGRCRLGVSVSRKYGNAVKRNRWKRLIREAFRKLQHEFSLPMDIVVRPRKGAQPEYHAICRSLVKLVKKIQTKITPC